MNLNGELVVMPDIFEMVCDIAGSDNVKKDEYMSAHTTFRIGGKADVFVSPRDYESLGRVMKLCIENQIPYFILGNGSNLLVSDDGYRGVIINISDNMNDIEVDGERIICGAGNQLIKVSRIARDEGLAGMEFASGIPGTIGGAVYMNAGAYGGEMKDIVTKVTAMDSQGLIHEIDGKDMDFSYRHSVAEEKNLTVLKVEIKLERRDTTEISARMEELAKARREKQPLEYPSAGSTFKRPEGYFAGKLIMDAGLRGFSVGDAQVSEKHCGFVINRGKATAGQVKELIEHVQREVMRQFGVRLETEVKLLGEF